MSMKKKLLIAFGSVAAAIVLVVTSVLGTVAYLTSSAAVSNVFTIGNVGITMFESKVNPDGTKVDPNSDKKEADTNTYHLVNQETYVKDPTIYVNAGSEKSYLFIIARNDIASIEAYEVPTMREQLHMNGWMRIDFATAATGNIYVYTGVEKMEGWAAKCQEILDAATAEFATAKTDDDKARIAQNRAQALDDLYDTFNNNQKVLAVGVGDKVNTVAVDLFQSFTIHPTKSIAAFGAAKVTVTAVAIQTTGFGDDTATVGSTEALKAAWDAVIESYPYIHTGNTPTT